MMYAIPGGAIDAAAAEIAKELLRVLPPPQAEDLRAHLIPLAVGTAGLDVLFVIDTTGSMGEDIAEAVRFAKNNARTINGLGGRVALVAYRDAGDAYTARLVTDFTTDVDAFATQLDGLVALGGGDGPEALFHALMTGFNEVSWRNGATKAAVVLTDAGFHNPDRVDGTTLPQVVTRALEIDPVNVYPVVSSDLVPQYQALADQTAGQVIPKGTDTEAALTTALTRLRDRPLVSLPLLDYYGEIGDAFMFEARTISFHSPVIAYDWDFEGDGTYDSTTTEPITTTTYGVNGTVNMQVRVRTEAGMVASASAKVHVGEAPPSVEQPAAPTDVAATQLSVQEASGTARLTWAAPVDPDSWYVTVNSVPVARVTGDLRSVEISDLALGEDIDLGVGSYTPDSAIGELGQATIRLTGNQPSPSPSGTPSPTGSGSTGPGGPPSTSPPSTRPTPGGNPGHVAADQPRAKPQTSSLAFTGTNVGIVAGTGAVLVLIGVAASVIARRRPRENP